MSKQSKSKVVRSWKSSKIQIKRDSKGLLWIVLDKEKVRLPKDVVAQTMKLQEVEELFNNLITEKIVSKTGRPSDYRIEYNEQVEKLCLLGATDIEIANFFNVDERTIQRWRLDFPEFCRSVKKGKELADSRVAESLFNRALGYKHEEDKIFNDQGSPLIVPTIKHYPPDTTAAIFWLKNRQPSKWRDKQEIDNNIKVEQPFFGDEED